VQTYCIYIHISGDFQGRWSVTIAIRGRGSVTPFARNLPVRVSKLDICRPADYKSSGTRVISPRQAFENGQRSGVADIRLDHFIDVRGAPVDRKLYVVLTTDDVFAAGSWTRTAATLQGFPGSGNWILNYVADPGVQVQDAAGNNICTLLFLTPRSTVKDGDALITAGNLPFSAARWHIQ